YEITELKTLIPFHRALLATEQWARAETCRDLVEDRKWLKQLAFPKREPAEAEEAEAKVEQDYTVEVSGRRFDVKVIGPPAGGAVNGAAAVGAAGAGAPPAARKPKRHEAAAGEAAGGGGDSLTSPIQGTVLRVAVEQGAQ